MSTTEQANLSQEQTELSDEQIWDMFSEALQEQHVSIPDGGIRFPGGVNIVIGPNGAGKTRFLNAMKQFYKKFADTDVLYGYFPDLSSSGDDIDPDAVPEFFLGEFLRSDSISFNDFFKEIESQHSFFLSHLLQPRSEQERKEYSKILHIIQTEFESFTGKKLIPYDPPKKSREKRKRNPIWMVSSSERGDKPVPLETELELFSPGERMLLYMSLFFALRKEPVGERDQIIILDEPEAHLHPDALIKFVTNLSENFPDAGILIATHSLFLLPLLEFENVFYMENGQVLPRDSKLYTKILSSMLGPYGGDVQRFFSSLPRWQYGDFIAECFTNPQVVDIVNPKDEQVQIFIDALRTRKLRKILDYGGGSGRLGKSAMAELRSGWEDIEYHIFDKENQYDGTNFTFIDDINMADLDYDCVVMMNVLHEVDPKEWVQVFIDLYIHLATNGCLLFVEVDALRNGEYPNDTGYLLLGPDELKVLFKLQTAPAEVKVNKDSKHRGFLIPFDALQAITEDSVNDAIQKLEERTYREIKEIRAQGKEPANSRKYAFLLQQYINAKLFNEKRGGKQELPSGVSPTQKYADL